MANEIIIDDSNYTSFLPGNVVVNGETKMHGLMPRNFSTHPVGYLACAQPFNLPLIPESEWQARLDARVAAKAQLSDVRNTGMWGQPIPSRDQNGRGFCIPPGSLVWMADGSKKPIELVRLGDKVLDSFLQPRRVLQTHQRLYTGTMVSLRINGLEEPLITTGDHHICTSTMNPAWTRGFTTERAESFGLGSCLYALQNNRLEQRLVRSVGKRDVRDVLVYDIGVEEDHYFIAGPGVLISNCWAHSGVSAHLIARAVMGESYADLSAYAVAAVIKSFHDEGGFGSEGVEFQGQRGCPTSDFWPQQSMDRANDNPRTWENAAKHKYTQWCDLDPSNMKSQLITCLLSDCPVVVDYNWWSHSVCAVDLVSVNPFSIRIWNSWSDSWGSNGMGVLQGSKAMPDAAVACLTVMAS
ncbi:MAG: hypothetical protein KGL39_00365 [Patescibacteria group bacterium]|nr:hypothetical protein [Patescibacteria group bacterium]